MLAALARKATSMISPRHFTLRTKGFLGFADGVEAFVSDFRFIANKKGAGVSLRLVLLFLDVILSKAKDLCNSFVADTAGANKKAQAEKPAPSI
jgi:hypothetical protein